MVRTKRCTVGESSAEVALENGVDIGAIPCYLRYNVQPVDVGALGSFRNRLLLELYVRFYCTV